MAVDTRVAVIGGGIAGSSLLYHLTRLGWSDVTLLEQNELTSGSTWHAAGLLTQFIDSPYLMRLLRRSLALYEELDAGEGQSMGLHRCGSVRLGFDDERLFQFERVRAIAEQVGVPFDIITPERLVELFPLVTPDDVRAAAYLPDDGHVDSSSVTQALAQSALAAGARLLRHEPVVGMSWDGRCWTLETPKRELRAEFVVNAAGQWARQVGRLAGVELPIVPLQHHYVVTEPIDEVRALAQELPVLRDPAASYYIRQEGEALMVGPFEPNALAWAVDGIPEGFHGKLLPPLFDQIEPTLLAAARRVPVLHDAGIKTIVNGPDGYTPDGRCLMGPVPGVRNYHVLAGFSIFGVVFGGGAGRYAAEWLTEGQPSDDMWELDVRRFGPYASSSAYAVARAREVYEREYAIHFPEEELAAGRPLKTSPLYDRLTSNGAVWGARFGWERPLWFDPVQRRQDEYSFRRGNWFDAVGDECRAVRAGVGVLDQSSFAKFELSGPGAGPLLDRLCSNALPGAAGRMALTQMCTPAGGIECDVTVTRLAEDRFYIVSAAATEHHDLAWIAWHLPDDGSVTLDNVTGTLGVLTLAGPRSRELLEAVTDADVSREAFPFFSALDLHVGMAPVRALRVSYVGELGFELHHPMEYQRHVYDALCAAGEPLGLVDFGYRALDSMRLEKAYRLWGPDMSSQFTPLEAGMERFVRLDKGNFIGRDALLRQQEEGVSRRLCCLVVEAADADAHGYEPLFADGRQVGSVTSGGYGHAIGSSLALGYVEPSHSAPGTPLEVRLLGENRIATVVAEPPYDPENLRLRA